MRYLPICLLYCALLPALLPAVTVDRLAIAVGSTVITELQIDEDLRVAALLNGQSISRDIDSRRAAADRLVEQLLIQHEIQLSRYPEPTRDEVDVLYSAIQADRGGPERMKTLFATYDISEDTLRAHLRAQLTTLRFIEFRFRPDISITDNEVEAAYRRQAASRQVANPNTPLPPLDAKEREKLTQLLMEERTDAVLDTWLAESRKQINIVYIDSALR